MRLPLPLIAVAASVAIAASASEPGRFTITGNVTDVPDGTVMTIYNGAGDLLTVIARDTVMDGRFCFTDTVSGPVRTVYMSPNSNGTPSRIARIFVEPGAEINVTGQGLLYPLWHITSNIPRQNSVERFTAATMPEFESYLRLNAEESDLIKYLYRDKKGAEEYVKPTWQKIDSLRSVAMPFRVEMERKKLEYMAQAPIDEEWLETYSDYARQIFADPDMDNADVIRNLYSRLSDDDLSTPDGQAIREWMEMEKKLVAGDDLPHAEFADTSGNAHTFNEFLDKYVLIDFWSRGCGPCIQSIPEAEEVAEMYDGRLAFVGVSIDPVDVWKEFVESEKLKGIHWNGYVDKGISLYNRFGSSGIPTYVLVSPERKIVSVWSGYGPGSIKKALERHLPSSPDRD